MRGDAKVLARSRRGKSQGGFMRWDSSRPGEALPRGRCFCDAHTNPFFRRYRFADISNRPVAMLARTDTREEE